MLLSCASPRRAWLMVISLPLQDDRAIYFMVFASSLTAEYIMHLLGSVFKGRASDYARQDRTVMAVLSKKSNAGDLR